MTGQISRECEHVGSNIDSSMAAHCGWKRGTLCTGDPLLRPAVQAIRELGHDVKLRDGLLDLVVRQFVECTSRICFE